MSDTLQPLPTLRSHSLHLLGALFSAIACVASLMLVMHHLGGLSLPGCQAGSACDEAARSAWGKVPGISWPVSFVGLAYFAGALLAWLTSRSSGVSPGFRNVVRLGLLISVVYVFVIIFARHPCIYCIFTHAANVFFWVTVELAPRLRTPPARGLGSIAGAFIAVSLILGLVQSSTKEELKKTGEKQLAESVKEITDSGKDPAKSQSVSVNNQGSGKSPSQLRWPNGFTGRHRLGPEKAPIRIVLLSDYQCPDCQRIEGEISTMMATRNDVSIGFRYFPMCLQCNKYLSQDLHPNACWAARAAETAFILGGEDGFWKVHNWLWDKKGKFEKTEELLAGVTPFGFNPQEFVRVLTDDTRSLPPILEDIEEGQWLGIFYTPMVFINGVELKGVFTPGAIPRAVEALAATHPQPAGPENDLPPPAEKKYIDDWLDRPQVTIPPVPWEHPLGPEGAKVQVVVWGDLAEPNSARVDQILREEVAKRSDVQYHFHHFPINQACNASCQVTRNEKACIAHKAALAAHLLGGEQAYHKMHNWLMDNQTQVTEETIKQNAFQIGLDVNAFTAKMEGPEVMMLISQDAALGKRFGLTQVPWIYINGRQVPRWIRGNKEIVIPKMLDQAAK